MEPEKTTSILVIIILIVSLISCCVSRSVSEGHNISPGTSEKPRPEPADRVVAVSAGETHALALLENGTVVAWGSNSRGQSGVPRNLTNITAIAAGGEFSIAVKQGGSVVAWGCNWEPRPAEGHYHIQTMTCDNSCPCRVPENLTHVRTVSAGNNHVLALRDDGTVVAWGRNYNGECNVPSGLRNVTAISAGTMHSLALKEDGSVVAWGRYTGRIPVGYRNCSGIAAGTRSSLILRDDGTLDTFKGIVAEDSPELPINHPSLSNVTAIAAGSSHYLALLRNGSVVSWTGGSARPDYQNAITNAYSNITAISAGGMCSLALKDDGTVFVWGDCRGDRSCDLAPPPGIRILSVRTGNTAESLRNVTVTTAPVFP